MTFFFFLRNDGFLYVPGQVEEAADMMVREEAPRSGIHFFNNVYMYINIHEICIYIYMIYIRIYI